MPLSNKLVTDTKSLLGIPPRIPYLNSTAGKKTGLCHLRIDHLFFNPLKRLPLWQPNTFCHLQQVKKTERVCEILVHFSDQKIYLQKNVFCHFGGNFTYF